MLDHGLRLKSNDFKSCGHALSFASRALDSSRTGGMEMRLSKRNLLARLSQNEISVRNEQSERANIFRYLKFGPVITLFKPFSTAKSDHNFSICIKARSMRYSMVDAICILRDRGYTACRDYRKLGGNTAWYNSITNECELWTTNTCRGYYSSFGKQIDVVLEVEECFPGNYSPEAPGEEI